MSAASTVPVQLPRWGLTAEEATVLEWMVGEGEEVEQGEVLLTIETDKATGDVEAPASGRLTRVLVSEGDTVRPGDLLAEIESDWRKEVANRWS